MKFLILASLPSFVFSHDVFRWWRFLTWALQWPTSINDIPPFGRQNFRYPKWSKYWRVFLKKSEGYILPSAAGKKTLKTRLDDIKHRRYRHFIFPSMDQTPTILKLIFHHIGAIGKTSPILNSNVKLSEKIDSENSVG